MKKGFELSLHAVVDLVLAAMALVVVMLIISTVLFALYSEAEAGQKSGFKNIISSIENNEKAGVETEMKPVYGYLKEEFIFVGFSKGEKEISGKCTHESLYDYWYSDLNPANWGNNEVNVISERPDKCGTEDEPACLCLCKMKWVKDSVKANCVEGMCYPFRDYPDLEFRGGENCDVPIMYRNEQDLYNYCLKWENDYIKFQPHECKT